MKPNCILVNAFRREQCLSVCLEGIIACQSVDEWDVWVDIDGGGMRSILDTESVRPTWIVRGSNLGNRDHFTAMLGNAISLEYERVLYCEEDMLLRRDALVYLLSCRPADMVSLYAAPGLESDCCYVSNAPVMLTADSALDLYNFMQSKRWVGLANVCEPDQKPITESCPWFDICAYAWAVDGAKRAVYPKEALALNFGLVGENHDYKAFMVEAFKGQRKDWLRQVVSLCGSQEYAHLIRTPGFKYA